MRGTIAVIMAFGSAASLMPWAAEAKEEKIRAKRFEAQEDRVHEAIVEAVSSSPGFDMLHSEGRLVSFSEREHPGSKWSEGELWTVTAVCHADGDGTVVTLHFKPDSFVFGEQNKTKDDLAAKFWSRLEKVLKGAQ
jgi:hypothetical protein